MEDRYKVAQGKYNMKAQQVRKGRPAYDSDIQRTWDQRQNDKFEELGNRFEDENKSLLGYSASKSLSENSKKVNERKMPSQTSPKKSRKQAFEKYSTKSDNNRSSYAYQNRYNREASYSDARNSSSGIQNSYSYQKSDKPNELPEFTSRQNVKHEAKNSSSRIQNSNLCPKTDKSNELSTSTNRQNVKHDYSSEITHGCGLDNIHSRMLTNNKSSTEKKNSCLPNVKYEECISFDANHPNEDASFKDLGLVDLLYYNVDLMQHQQLVNYAFALKKKTLEVISEFKDSVRDELKFLCAITDGSQTDRNQKLISGRMYFIIANAIEELSNAYCERQVCEQTQNLNLTSRINELNRLPQHTENIKHVDPDFLKHTEATEESNFVDSCHKNNSLDPLVIKSRETVSVTNMNLETNNMSKVRAPEKISNNAPLTCEEDTYSSFGFEKFFNYNVNKMHGSSLLHYAFALKEKILEKRFEIQEDAREKLEFLCEITDGWQTEENQKLIIHRMHYLLSTNQPKDRNSFFKSQNNSDHGS